MSGAEAVSGAVDGDIDAAIAEAWRDWHGPDFDSDWLSDASPVFVYGFRVGVERPGTSARVAWDAYAGNEGIGGVLDIPPALVEGINRGAEWGLDQ